MFIIRLIKLSGIPLERDGEILLYLLMEQLLMTIRRDILAIYGYVDYISKEKSNQELEEYRHKADEIRKNPNKDWSERTAAEMIYTAASEKLGL